MKAGRELDAKIHKEIFGHEIEICPMHHSHSCCGRNLPNYSTQIADAWLVVEKLAKENYGFGIYITTIIDLDGGLHDNWGCYFENDDFEWEVEEETAPLAICLAALKAVESNA